MKTGEITIEPLASESMGVRSMCTLVKTPDIEILFDPSAALSMRYGLEPHPLEYQALLDKLQRIFVAARKADILSISHFHFDHCRPGFTDFRYNLSSREELQRMFEGKIVLAKDNRENINPSQRRRGFYFEKDVKEHVKDIIWADGESFSFGSTTITYSHVLPHGPPGTRLGFVLATTVEYDGVRFLYAPDVQGPVSTDSLTYLKSAEANIAIVGGPPTYLSKFIEADRNAARDSLKQLASNTPFLAVDHHLLRSEDWHTWLDPVRSKAESLGHTVTTMAEMAGTELSCLEANRKRLYDSHPPSQLFLDWTLATDDYKQRNLPPL
ncbi:MAG: MBL fold metallo-hydrolase [Promethearchaeota archaeon]